MHAKKINKEKQSNDPKEKAKKKKKKVEKGAHNSFAW